MFFLLLPRVSWNQPIRSNFSDGLELLTTGLPGSGALLSFILNIFDDYGFTPASIADFNATILTYHRMIETFKYAFALRTKLGDGTFIDMTEVSISKRDHSIPFSFNLIEFVIN